MHCSHNMLVCQDVQLLLKLLSLSIAAGKAIVDHLQQVGVLQCCRHTLLVIELLVDSSLC